MLDFQSPLVKSVAFHLAVILLVFLAGLEIFGQRKPDETIVPIMVEMVQIADKNNIPKAAAPSHKKNPDKPKEKPKPKKPKPKTEKKPEPKPEPKPAEKPKEKPAPKPQDKPKPEEKRKPEENPEKPKDKPKKEDQKTQPDELESLLKSMEEEQTEQPDLAQTAEEFDPTQPLSVTEENAILALITKQIQACWNVPAGARNAGELKVAIDVDIAQDGTLKFIGFADGGNSGDPFYQVAQDSARRAILDPRCNPLRELPPADKYGFWSQLTIVFDPENQIY